MRDQQLMGRYRLFILFILSGVIISSVIIVRFPSSASASSSYDRTFIGYGSGFGINSAGNIAGEARIGPNSSQQAAFWSGGSVTAIGTLGGVNSIALGIDDADEVVGAADISTGAEHAFIWTPAGGIKDLGTLGGATSRAYAVNGGVVVGTSTTANGEGHAFKWTEAGGMEDLGTSGISSVARGINGSIVGIAGNHAATFPGGDLGTLGGATSEADAVHGSMIVGSSLNSSGFSRAVIFSGSGAVQDLGTLGGIGSNAFATDGMAVVGASLTANGQTHAFIYENNVMSDLNVLAGIGDDPQFNTAYGIAGGKILVNTGGGTIEVLTPSAPTPTPSPTPSNQAPVVSAGADLQGKTGVTIILSGSVSDDGLPNPPGQVSASWSVVSGPGNVHFQNASQPVTIATFDRPGTYVLQLTASDSQLSASDTVTVKIIDHYHVELKAWIPQASTADPLMISKFGAPNKNIPAMGGTLKNCFAAASVGSLLGSTTVLDSQFKGDTHSDYGIINNTSQDYRTISTVDFDFDGSTIFNFKQFADTGSTERFMFIQEGPHGAQLRCSQVAKADPSINPPSTLTSSSTFTMGVKGTNPLMPIDTIALCKILHLICDPSQVVPLAPSIDGKVTGSIQPNGDLSFSYTTDFFPSYGVAVTRNEGIVMEKIIGDASCVYVQGYPGAANVLVRLQTKALSTLNTGTVNASSPNSVCLPNVQSKLINSTQTFLHFLVNPVTEPSALIFASHLPQ